VVTCPSGDGCGQRSTGVITHDNEGNIAAGIGEPAGGVFRIVNGSGIDVFRRQSVRHTHDFAAGQAR
jgi:hypothetical protein